MKSESIHTNDSNKAGNKLTVLPLIFITTALFLTLRNMPAMAQTGMHMIFFNIITVFAFLVPIALVSAELATGWPEKGVYSWVSTSFGRRAGFVAMWLQWSQSIFGLTSILAYVGATFAYVISPELGENNIFVTITIISVYWIATIMNFKGTKTSGMISSWALIIGVILPSVLLIVFGILYFFSGNTIQLDTTLSVGNFLPSINNTNQLVLFLSFIFGFVGIEVSASHAKEVVNPQRNFPIALFTAAIIGFFITLLGGFAISFVTPINEISPDNGAMQAFSKLFKVFDLVWLIPAMAFLVALGAAGQVSTWIVGPVQGLHTASQDGILPPYFKKTNRYGVPIRLLIVQASIISLVGLFFLLAKNVNTMFLMLTSTAIILYAVMYIMMFLAAIRLRYTRPEVKRAYQVPGGKFGIWIVSGIGATSILACLIIGFIPPEPSPLGVIYFEIILGGICFLVVLLGFLIYHYSNKKKQSK